MVRHALAYILWVSVVIFLNNLRHPLVEFLRELEFISLTRPHNTRDLHRLSKRGRQVVSLASLGPPVIDSQLITSRSNRMKFRASLSPIGKKFWTRWFVSRCENFWESYIRINFDGWQICYWSGDKPWTYQVWDIGQLWWPGNERYFFVKIISF